jgi:hypothetical protein
MQKGGFDFSFFEWAAVLGLLIGVGQVLDSDERLTWRVVAGRGLVSAGLAAIAPVALIWLPDMPRIAQFALAAAFASLGTSGLQVLMRWVLTRKM